MGDVCGEIFAILCGCVCGSPFSSHRLEANIHQVYVVPARSATSACRVRFLIPPFLTMRLTETRSTEAGGSNSGAGGNTCRCCRPRFDDEDFVREEVRLQQNAARLSVTPGHGEEASGEVPQTHKSKGVAMKSGAQPEAKEGMTDPTRTSKELPSEA